MCTFLRLADTLQPWLDDNKLEVEGQMIEELPDDITIAQTVAVWKHIVAFQANQKQD